MEPSKIPPTIVEQLSTLGLRPNVYLNVDSVRKASILLLIWLTWDEKLCNFHVDQVCSFGYAYGVSKITTTSKLYEILT